MTDKQRLALLRKARKHLENTQKGYLEKPVGGGSEWKAAMKALDTLAADLRPKPKPPAVKIPDLGPLWRGGTSVLDMVPTHKTSGLDFYPAFDDAFVEGREIIAPENITISRSSSSKPGLAFYAIGASHLKYWFGHLDRTHQPGEDFKKGEVIGKVCRNTIGGGPHTHCGINIEQLVGRGKQLKYGKTGNGPDYTFGSPTIRQQLKALL